MPLNGELRMRNARFIEETKTTADYRLFALAGGEPPKPGMLRVADGEGAAITVEVWALTAEAFGRFVAAMSAAAVDRDCAPRRRQQRQGFPGRGEAVNGARDISSFGGWRAYMAGKG